jgi:hypothetical protein
MNLPFHPAAGSQISILISESGEGLSVAAIRQNAGRSFCGTDISAAVPPSGPSPGVLGSPAATTTADSTAPFVNAVERKFSQEAACAQEALISSATNTNIEKT